MTTFIDLIAGTSTTTGTGSYAISGSVDAFRPFSDVADSTEVTVYVSLGSEYELVTGVVSGTGTTLTRATVHKSSNSGAAVNWGAGTKTLRVVASSAMLEGLSTPVTGQMGPDRRSLKVWSHLHGTPATFSSSTTGTIWGADQAEIWAGGTGAAVTQGTAVVFRLGTAICATGTTSSGYAGITSTLAPLFIVEASAIFDIRVVASMSHAPGGVNDYTAQVGIFTVPTALATQGMFFRGSNADTNWQAVSKNTGGETETDTGVAVGTDWHTFRIAYDFNDGNVIYYIDGTQVASISTDFPGVTSLYGGGAIHKTVGTADRSLRVDAYSIELNDSTGTMDSM